MLTHGYRRTLYINKPIFIYHFERVKVLTPQEFVAKIKQDFPNLKEIIVGYDFEFGYKKSGNVEILKTIFDGRVTMIEEIEMDNISVHSRTIKEYLRNGNLTMANRLLGRSYEMQGVVVKGQGIGSRELVSTINISVQNYLLPKEGVYATRIFVNGAWYKSISFIGHRASTDNAFAIETHIIDRLIELKSRRVTLRWLDFIRSSKKFDTLEELKSQILKDIKKAKEIHQIL
jgi:riboflavin kinase/FMN adenylyltransferase